MMHIKIFCKYSALGRRLYSRPLKSVLLTEVIFSKSSFLIFWHLFFSREVIQVTVYRSIGVTWGGGGKQMLLQYFVSTLWIEFGLATELTFVMPMVSGVPRNFVRGGGFNKFSWGQRERGSGGGSPLVRGSGGSCNFVQEISFHIVNFSYFFSTFKTIYGDNQFICHC